MRQAFPTSEEAEPNPQPLFAIQLLKAIPAEGDAPWKFAGIASDESADLEGDKILKKAIDLSYAQQRGYVNWDHSRAPEDQLGYLTKAEIIPTEKVQELKKNFPGIKDSASIYVEGELYKGIPRAAHVYSIMKALPEQGGGLGLSLDGSLARDLKSGGVIKAYVRGVAVTAQPMHPNTLVQLRKSIAFYNECDATGIPTKLIEDNHREVMTAISELRKSTTGPQPLDHDQAVLFVLKQRPNWSLELATKLVEHTMKNGANDVR